jgi:hypothetical protein
MPLLILLGAHMAVFTEPLISSFFVIPARPKYSVFNQLDTASCRCDELDRRPLSHSRCARLRQFEQKEVASEPINIDRYFTFLWAE